MHLSDIISNTKISASLHGDDVDAFGICADSRHIKKGDIFSAIIGNNSDGNHYIAQAIERGASAVLTRKAHAVLNKSPYILTDNERIAYAKIAACLYGPQPTYCTAITGTNGKTSVAEFIRQICQHAGENAASIGTLGLHHTLKNTSFDYTSSNTSPDAAVLHQALQQLNKNNIQYCAIEASSHGLDQYRLDGIDFCAAAFTNFSQDHMDYHKTKEHYFQAKMRLFSLLKKEKTALICADDPAADRVISYCESNKIDSIKTYGIKGKEHIIFSYKLTEKGINATIGFAGETVELKSTLYGEFQINNILCAMALCLEMGIEKHKIIASIPQLKAASGRLEKITLHPCGAPVFIDYAHTPDALKNALQSIRSHTKNNVHLVFGCGGDRDQSKRTLMGEVAKKYAHNIWITDDNPRNENAADIRAAIKAACPNATEIADRKEAIYSATKNLKKGDALIIAGKGHETYQIIGSQTYDFNDAECIKEAIATL